MKPYLKEFGGVEYLLIHAETAEEKELLERFGADGTSVVGNLRKTDVWGTYLRFELPAARKQAQPLKNLTLCGSCRASIVFLKNKNSGNTSPVDAEPSANGNIRILSAAECEVLPTAECQTARAAGEPLYTSHFATCPNAAKFRGQKNK